MNVVELKYIKIYNFRGIGKYEKAFSNREVIREPYGAGKTTIYEAYKWVLCCSNISPDPIIDGEIKREVPVEVYLTLTINNRAIELYRAFKRETSIINKFMFCGIEYNTEKQYKAIICEIFGVSEDMLKFVVDIKAFTTICNAWTKEKQRELLFNICNVNGIEDELLSTKKYSMLLQFVEKKTKGKTSFDRIIKRELAETTTQKKANISVIKDIKNKLPLKPLVLDDVINEYEELKRRLSDIKIKENEQHIYEKEIQQSQKRLSNTNCLINEYKSIIKENIERIESIEQDIKSRQDVLNNLKDYKVCPICGQSICENTPNKQKATKYIGKYTDNLKQQIEQLEKSKRDCVGKIERLNKELDRLGELVNELEPKTANKEPQINTAYNSEEIEKINKRITEIQNEMRVSAVYETYMAEIERLSKDVIELADKEGKLLSALDTATEFLIDKANAITDNINKEFNPITFRFYSKNLSGTLNDDCEILLCGVPYDMCSTGQKISINFYITKTLQRLCGVNLPIWIDDLGSAKFFRSDTQTIGLLTDNSVKQSITPITQTITI